MAMNKTGKIDGIVVIAMDRPRRQQQHKKGETENFNSLRQKYHCQD